MYKKTINHVDVGKTTYTVYQKDEADKAGIEYKHWQIAEQGDYCVTDDDWVSKIIKRNEYEEFGRPDRIGVYIYTPVGTVIWHKKYKTKKFRKGNRKNIHSVSGKQSIHGIAQTEQMLAKWYAVSGDLPFSIQMVHGDVTKNKGISLRVLAKTEAFKSMVNKEMRSLLDDSGFGQADTMTYLKEAIEMAKDKENIAGFIRLVENLLDLNQMKAQDKVKETRQLEMSKQQAIADVIESESLMLTETLEKPIEEAQVVD